MGHKKEGDKVTQRKPTGAQKGMGHKKEGDKVTQRKPTGDTKESQRQGWRKWRAVGERNNLPLC
jgi:hypothetical protein